MTLSNMAGSVSIALYALTTLLTIDRGPAFITRSKLGLKSRRLILAFAASFFHLLVVLTIFHANGGINLSFFRAGALVILIVVLLLNTASLRKPVEKLGLLIYPMAATTLLMNILFPSEDHIIKGLGPGLEAHIIVSITAYSLFNIAATQAVLLALQDYQLRHREPNRFIRSLPPLQTMEILLFQMITAGFVFLTASLASGMIYVTDLFDQHLAHKTVLSIIAWIVFSTLLWGRYRHGWRGQTAIRWTLSGFATLVLAYFGSKMVLEIILG